jgi:hypothetical protein
MVIMVVVFIVMIMSMSVTMIMSVCMFVTIPPERTGAQVMHIIGMEFAVHPGQPRTVGDSMEKLRLFESPRYEWPDDLSSKTDCTQGES